MQDFRQEMCRVGRFGHDNPCIDMNGTVGPRNGIAQAVEKDDILLVDLDLSPAIYFFG